MCDVASEKLLPWLDGELSATETAEIERHLQKCRECRARLDLYRRASAAFDAYCDRYADSVIAAGAPREIRTWAVAAVAAAIGALLLLVPQFAIRKSSSAALPEPVPQSAAMPRFANATQEADHPHPQTPTARLAIPSKEAPIPTNNALPAVPAFEIAIPADAIFPPGAFPAGVSFTADVAIAPDGSAQQIRLQPQVVEFERRPNQR
jgi:anti-sigma factor RsiW